ncbi:DUF742 domain-containing protein [Amycolatopsis sp. CA-161197]|uniref:DUF742 domain-containing protein n=1 Tax=Amycolatopsis sp. CA-161197 TaxID=3239922 RepID=UPI003D93104C
MRISGFGEQDTGAWDALHKGTDREGVDSPSHFELSTLKTMLPHRRPAASAVPPPAPVRPVAPVPAAPESSSSSEYYDDDGYEWVEDGESGYWQETGTSSGYYDAESYLTHEDRQVPEDSAYYQAPERRHLAAVEEPESAAGYQQDAANASGYQRVPESYGYEPAPSDAAYASGCQQAPVADDYHRGTPAPDAYATGYEQAPASDAAHATRYRQAPASDAYAMEYHQAPGSDAASGYHEAPASDMAYFQAPASDAAYSTGYHRAPVSDAAFASGYHQTPAPDSYAPGYQHAEPYSSGHHQLPASDAGYPVDYNRSAAPESHAEHHRPSGDEYSSGYFEAPAYESAESTGRHAVVAPSHQDQRRAAVDIADRDRPHRPTPADTGYLPPADAQHRLAEPPERITGRRRAPEPVAPQQDSYAPEPATQQYAPEPVAAHQDQDPAEPYSPEPEQAWSREDRTPAAKPAKSRVRPYARTRGRTRSDHNLALEALVSTSDDGRRYRGVRSIEHRRICDLCLDTRSVAEIAAHLHLPLGVVKVLVGDMADIGLVLIHQTELVLGDRSSRDFMERVLQGLRNL